MKSVPGESQLLEAESGAWRDQMASSDLEQSPEPHGLECENADDDARCADEPITDETSERACKEHRHPRTSAVTNGLEGVPNEVELRALMKRTGCPIVQTNGQRRYGPPPDWRGDSPPRGCEVFVGKIPRDLFENELVPVFESVGRIYELRLMMDFSGANRGYAFVVYTTKSDAQRCVKCLNNYEIRKGRFLGVCFSVDNCRLFVGGIPKKVTKEEILAEMRKITEGVMDVIVYPSVADKSRNRGFAFVEYDSHRAAAMARRKLMKTRVQLWGHQIAIDWAEPEQEVDEDTMAQVKVLYVRNLMLSTTEETLQREFGRLAQVERVKKIRDFAFVHYTKRDDAIKVMKAMNGQEIDGSQLEVTLAKPVDKEQYNFYKSIRSSQRMAQIAMQAAVTSNGFYNQHPTTGNMVAPSLQTGLAPQAYNYYDPARPTTYVQTNQGSRSGRAQVGVVRPAYNGYLFPGYHSNVQTGSIAVPQVQASVASPSVSGTTPAPTSSKNLPPQAVASPAQQHYLQAQPPSPYFTAAVSPATSPTALPPTSKGGTSSEQMLEEICLKNGWGKPMYSVHRVTDTSSSGGNLFFQKITVPALSTFQAQSPTLSKSKEEARQLAADAALTQITLSYGLVLDGAAPQGETYIQQFAALTTGQTLATTVVTSPMSSSSPSKLSPVGSAWPMTQDTYASPYGAYAATVSTPGIHTVTFGPGQLAEVYAPFAASSA